MRTDVRPRRDGGKKRDAGADSARRRVQAKVEAEREEKEEASGEASLFTNNKVQAGAKEDEASFLADWMDGNSRNANSAPWQPCRLCTRHIAPG